VVLVVLVVVVVVILIELVFLLIQWSHQIHFTLDSDASIIHFKL